MNVMGLNSHLCFIEVFHSHTVNGGTQTSGAVGLLGTYTDSEQKQEDAKHLDSAPPLPPTTSDKTRAKEDLFSP